MIHETHDLLHELPEHADRIKELQVSDETFSNQLKDYNRLDQHIQEAELQGTPLDDFAFEQLKKQRLAMKDSLFHRILNTAA